MISLSFNTIPTEPNNNSNIDALTGFTGTLAKRAKLSKAMWLLVIIDVLFVLAGLTALFIPIKNNLGITSGDIRVAFYIFIGYNVLLVVGFACSEIVINFVHGRGFKD